MSDSENYLSVKEAADRLTLTETEVRTLAKTEVLKSAVRTHNNEPWKILESSVAHFERKRSNNYWDRLSNFFHQLGQNKLIIVLFAVITFVLYQAIPTINDVRDFYLRYAPTEPMPSHKYNIAIAPTAFINDSSWSESILDCNSLGRFWGQINSDIGKTLSENLKQRLDDGKLSSASYSLRGPDQVRPIRCSASQNRLNLVAESALAHNASVFIYSTIVSNGVSEKLSFELYISERDFVYAPELAGLHSMGEVEIYNKNKPPDGDFISEEGKTSQYMELISLLAVALRYYESEDYQTSYNLLTHIASCEEHFDAENRPEVFLLLLGNIAGKLEHFSEAIKCFKLALQSNNRYARSYVGLAEVYYQHAINSSTYDLAITSFEQAEEALVQAEELITLPDTENVAIKIDFALGRIALYRSHFFQEPKNSDAQSHFQSIVNRGKSRSPTSEHVALAHGYLGIIAAAQKDRKVAEQELQIAIQTINSSQAKAGFLVILADVYADEGKINDAIQKYEEAISIELNETRRSVYVDALKKLKNMLQSGKSDATPIF